MATTGINAETEGDVTPPSQETLQFDDDTLRGEEKTTSCRLI